MIVWYVYVDYTNDNRAFYVGKGNINRVMRIKRNKLHKHISEKHGINRRIVLSTLDESLALDYEKLLIKKLKTFVYDSDYKFGANFTVGGDGVSGFKQSKEGLESNRKTHSFKKHSEDTCEKKSLVLKSSLKVLRRSVVGFKDGITLKFASITAAEKATGVAATLITKCCRGHRKFAGKFSWRYENFSIDCDKSKKPSGKNKPRKVSQTTLDGVLIKVFDTIASAANSIGKTTSSIRNCCDGKNGRVSAYGFIWKYVE